MRRAGLEFVADQVTKFFDTVYIRGWLRSPDDRLATVTLTGAADIQQRSTAGAEDYPGVDGAHAFQLQALLGRHFSWDLTVEFRTSRGRRVCATLQELSDDRISYYSSNSVGAAFVARVNAQPDARVLDVGGRDRSQFDRRTLFNVKEYVVLDIVPSANVDVVADAHELSRSLEPESFDFVVSSSVFEHLLMPWKVALEINRVLKPGGMAFITTAQTVGLHDMPWDFLRFSDTSWDGIFNDLTGFRIVERVMDYPMFILPFVIREIHLDTEKAAGYEMSAVVVEKIGKTELMWPVLLDDVMKTSYPPT